MEVALSVHKGMNALDGRLQGTDPPCEHLGSPGDGELVTRSLSSLYVTQDCLSGWHETLSQSIRQRVLMIRLTWMELSPAW